MKGVFVENQMCIQTHLRYSLDKIKKVINIKLKLVLMKYLPQGLQTLQ